MSGGSGTPTAPDREVTLDRVMLAMDVVDTLRHERQLVEAELDDDRRQRDLVERIRAIYDSQGIEVSEQVIGEGVAALREDRFVYSPPERSFRVWLAEAYVERGKWAIRLGIVALVGVLIWASYAIPSHFREQGRRRAFEQSVATLAAHNRDIAARAGVVEQALGRVLDEADLPAATRLLREAEDALLLGQGQSETLATGLQTLPDAERYLEDRGRWDATLTTLTGLAGDATAALDDAERSLAAVEQLEALRGELDAVALRLQDVDLSPAERVAIDTARKDVEAAIQAGDVAGGEAAMVALNGRIDAALAARQREAGIRARFAELATALEGVDIEPDAAAELASLRGSVEQAIAAGDWARAGTEVEQLADLVELLDRRYELRIVSRGNARSGVWRRHSSDRRIRNHYIIVEPVGPDGKRIALPIESEEDQTVRRVTRFGIRVPAQVYERVKADKLDNGIVDDDLFGTKQRGQREPEYRFPVAGGRITRW